MKQNLAGVARATKGIAYDMIDSEKVAAESPDKQGARLIENDV